MQSPRYHAKQGWCSAVATPSHSSLLVTGIPLWCRLNLAFAGGEALWGHQFSLHLHKSCSFLPVQWECACKADDHYGIYHRGSHGNDKWPGMRTRTLLYILGQYKCILKRCCLLQVWCDPQPKSSYTPVSLVMGGRERWQIPVLPNWQGSGFSQMPLYLLIEFVTTFPKWFGVSSLPIRGEINEHERDQDQLSLMLSSAHLLCM